MTCRREPIPVCSPATWIVANGIAVQAANGVARRELQRVADAALRHWPPA